MEITILLFIIVITSLSLYTLFQISKIIKNLTTIMINSNHELYCTITKFPPTINDFAEPGKLWIDSTNNNIYFYTGNKWITANKKYYRYLAVKAMKKHNFTLERKGYEKNQ